MRKKGKLQRFCLFSMHFCLFRVILCSSDSSFCRTARLCRTLEGRWRPDTSYCPTSMYRGTNERIDRLNKVQRGERTDSASFRIKRTDSGAYRGTRNHKKGLRIIWRDLRMYSRTRNGKDGLRTVWTDSESYGRTRNHIDGLVIV